MSSHVIRRRSFPIEENSAPRGKHEMRRVTRSPQRPVFMHSQLNSPALFRTHTSLPSIIKERPKQHKGATSISIGSQFPSRSATWFQGAFALLSYASQEISAKLAPRRSGPLQIIAQISTNDFFLAGLDSSARRGMAHADQLSLYLPPWSLSSPLCSPSEGEESCKERSSGALVTPRRRVSARTEKGKKV